MHTSSPQMELAQCPSTERLLRMPAHSPLHSRSSCSSLMGRQASIPSIWASDNRTLLRPVGDGCPQVKTSSKSPSHWAMSRCRARIYHLTYPFLACVHRAMLSPCAVFTIRCVRQASAQAYLAELAPKSASRLRTAVSIDIATVSSIAMNTQPSG